MTVCLTALEKLIAFDTVSARSNLAIIDYIEDFLRARGFRTTRLTDPEAQKSGLYAEIGPERDGGVLLSAHTDVVPVDGQDWSRAPFRLTQEDGRYYGRGTTDMKGFAAAMLHAADAAATGPLDEPLKLVFSYDEEVGCVGIQKMLDRLPALIGTPRACIVGEPTEMQVAIGHKGKTALRAVCHGQGGHSSLAPEFVNALHLAADFMAGLRQLQEELRKDGARDDGFDIPYSTVHVGTLAGGSALNIVPDRADLLCEFRHLQQDDPARLLARIQAIAAQVARAHGPDAAITLDPFNSYPGLDLAPEAEVVTWTKAMAAANGTIKVAYGTEAGFFDALGIPTLVCGPGSMAGQGHKPDEYITGAQLQACTAMLDRVVADLRG